LSNPKYFAAFSTKVARIEVMAVIALAYHKIGDDESFCSKHSHFLRKEIITQDVTLRPLALQGRDPSLALQESVGSGFIFGLSSAWKFTATRAVFIKVL
jgi:hypothetical protein